MKLGIGVEVWDMGKQLHVEMSSKELIPWDLKNILASILYFIKYDKIIHKELFFKMLIMAGFLKIDSPAKDKKFESS